MLAGNFIVGTLTSNSSELMSHTIILTLAMCFSTLWALDTARHCENGKKAWYYVIFFILLLLDIAGGLLFLEGAWEAILVLLIVYFCYPLKNGKLLMCLGIAVISVLLGSIMLPVMPDGTVDWDTFLSIGSDWAQLTVIPFILLYNGKPGPKSFLSKWSFYILYPAHLWIFAIVGMVLGV